MEWRPPSLLLLLFFVLLTAAAAGASPSYGRPKSTGENPWCRHGLAFADQCGNRCTCAPDGSYACTEIGCLSGTPGEPMQCEVEGEIRKHGDWRLFCKGGIVRIDTSGCIPGTTWQEDCNTCTCSPTQSFQCTTKECSTTDQLPIFCPEGNEDCHSGQSTPSGDRNPGVVQEPDVAVKTYCDGPCPAECAELWDEGLQCFSCLCLPELLFGDVLVPAEQPCPAGLQEGVTLLATKICQGRECQPGAKWAAFHDGCSRCVCTKDGEPACTPCLRGPSPSAVTCEGGYPECPQDCGVKYNPLKDCYDCRCGVGQPGDTHVSFDEPCPPGTDFREAGPFFKACGPVDTLPQGDTKLCETLECPADCGTVRVSAQQNCVYCQCGPELAPGDEVVPIDQECPPHMLPGATQLATKVCRAPTREECIAGTTYNLKCDICFCQEDGVPACTMRICSNPKYGDVQVCTGEYRECPADCGTAGSDSYCQFCQCGPRLDKGDLTVPIDQECPQGFVLKESQFATKTCSKAADQASKQYCDGPCPADCGEILDSANNCYRCQCGPELQFGDVVVAADSPCPAGLGEGQRLFATKVCRAEGCNPGSSWRVHHDGCSRCVCTEDGEPACTPCQRLPTESTLTCDEGLKECPQDCGQRYNSGRDCYECPCSVGHPGDIHVQSGEPCPPGTNFREAGAFFKACGPVDTLPQGDTKLCDTLECPADCGTVRVSAQQNCVYCQCGPELAPGDEVVPIDQECPPHMLPGATQLATKVCRAPTREECRPGTKYSVSCDHCICQDGGVPACTLRNCSLPKYGNHRVCTGPYSWCPQSCQSTGADGYCRYCLCPPGWTGPGTPPPPAPQESSEEDSEEEPGGQRGGGESSEEDSSEEDSSEEDSSEEDSSEERY